MVRFDGALSPGVMSFDNCVELSRYESVIYSCLFSIPSSKRDAIIRKDSEVPKLCEALQVPSIFVGAVACPSNDVAVEIPCYDCWFLLLFCFSHVGVQVLIEILGCLSFAWRVGLYDEYIVVYCCRNPA